MTPDLKKTVTDHAIAMGFDLVRVTSAEEFVRDRDEAIKRIDEGLMDGLSWYHEGGSGGSGPAEVIAGARSIICLGLNYYQNDLPEGSQRAWRDGWPATLGFRTTTRL